MSNNSPLDECPRICGSDQTTSRILRAAVEQATNAVVITDAAFENGGPRIVFVNEAFCRMTGYEQGELLGRSPRLLQGELTNPGVIANLRLSMAEGKPFRGSTVNYRKDGSPYTVEWSVTPIRDEDGRVVNFVSVQSDLSDLIAANASASLLAQALDSTGDAVFITDTSGSIRFANQAFETMTGYSRFEVLGQRASIMNSGMHDERFYRRLWQCLHGGRTFQAIFTNRHKSGHHIYCEATISPVMGQAGKPTNFIAVYRDVTNRVREEQELRLQATRDELTALLNRRAGQTQLQRAYFSSREGGRPLCVALIDVDYFKSVNDRWGHAQGDNVLKAVARILSEGCRATDSVVRWGGEEFMVVLPYTNLAAALAQAERLRTRVQLCDTGLAGAVTISIGVAELGSDANLDALIECADKALYRAKAAGRNRVMV